MFKIRLLWVVSESSWRATEVSARPCGAPITRARGGPRPVRALSLIGVTAALGCTRLPEVTIQATGATLTSEDGDDVAVSISLAEPPPARVTVQAVSSDVGEGQVSGAVTFDRQNWNTPQTITVSGVDDAERDGDGPYDVTFSLRTSQRPGLPPVTLKVLHFVNVDDDSASFAGLGDLPGGAVASYASDVSDSGDVVVGWSVGDSGDEAVRWTSGAGLEPLGGAPSRAHGVSSDGSLIVGFVPAVGTGYLTGTTGALWRGTGGYEPLIEPAPPPDQGPPALFQVVDGVAVVDDGRVFGICHQYGAYGEAIGCVYADQTIDILPGASTISAADSGGNYAGALNPERHAGGVFGPNAVYDGSQLGYPPGSYCGPNVGCSSVAQAFSVGGAVIAGTSSAPPPSPEGQLVTSPLVERAFLYTNAEQFVVLPDLEGGDDASGAYAVDASGRLIAGFGRDADGTHAVVWIDRVPIALEQLVAEAGGDIPDGWELTEVRAMSPDARTFVGNGVNPDGKPEGFRVILPKSR